jgi:hypothetical protein
LHWKAVLSLGGENIAEFGLALDIYERANLAHHEALIRLWKECEYPEAGESKSVPDSCDDRIPCQLSFRAGMQYGVVTVPAPFLRALMDEARELEDLKDRLSHIEGIASLGPKVKLVPRADPEAIAAACASAASLGVQARVEAAVVKPKLTR